MSQHIGIGGQPCGRADGNRPIVRFRRSPYERSAARGVAIAMTRGGLHQACSHPLALARDARTALRALWDQGLSLNSAAVDGCGVERRRS
jgi:hypothetical protein